MIICSELAKNNNLAHHPMRCTVSLDNCLFPRPSSSVSSPILHHNPILIELFIFGQKIINRAELFHFDQTPPQTPLHLFFAVCTRELQLVTSPITLALVQIQVVPGS
jgi:hypothetical protein